MKNCSWLKSSVAWAGILIAVVVLCGCPGPQPAPVAPTPEETTPPPSEPEPGPVEEPAEEPIEEPAEAPIEEPAEEPVEEPMEEPAEAPMDPPAEEPIEEPAAADAPVDLGAPLVDNPETLEKLDPEKPVWADQKQGRVVMVGQICQTDTPLEMFACLKDTKEHEAIVVVDVKAFVVHAGLLAIGADAGHPVKFDPEYAPAAGSEIDVIVRYKDEDGKVVSVAAQEWILDGETNKPMEHPWVFAGSGLWKDEATGETHYQAEGGDFICVSNFSTAMLDLPIESSQANSALMYQANSELIPPRGTPVTLVLTIAKADEPAEGEPAKEEPAEETPAKEAPVEEEPAKEAPVEEEPATEAPESEEPAPEEEKP